MKHQHILRLHVLQVFHHATEIDIAAGAVEIAIGPDLDAHMVGHGHMRGPCRIAQPQGGIAVDFLDRLIKLADRA